MKGSGGQTGREHITERHITNTNPKFSNSSKYVFNTGVGSRIASEPDPTKRLGIAQQAVGDYNAITFSQGARTNSGGNIVFVYGFPWGSGPGFDFEWMVGQIGRGFSHAGELSNINTLVLGSDRRRVITSHPGLPNNYTGAVGGSPPRHRNP